MRFVGRLLKPRVAQGVLNGFELGAAVLVGLICVVDGIQAIHGSGGVTKSARPMASATRDTGQVRLPLRTGRLPRPSGRRSTAAAVRRHAADLRRSPPTHAQGPFRRPVPDEDWLL